MTSTIIDRLDGYTGNVAMKAPCRAASLGNIALYGLQTIDGVALAERDRVLVKNQTDGRENGIYNATSGDWVRAPDFDGALDVVGGTAIAITDGTLYAATYWRVSGDGERIPGADVIGFDEVSITGEDGVTVVSGVVSLTPIADQRIVGNISGDIAAPVALTATEVKTLLSLDNVENKSSATIRSEISSGNVTTALGYTPASLTALAADNGAALIGVKVAATGASATTVYAKAREHGRITPEDFGAVGDGATNDYAALNAWLGQLGGTNGYWGELGPKTYRFETALSRNADNVRIKGHGHRSVLLYAGATTTSDILTIGTTGGQTKNHLLEDFKIESDTTMTAGAALKANYCVRSRFSSLIYGGQDGNGKIYDGIFLNGMDVIYLDNIDMYGRGDGLKACGFSDAAGSALYIDGGKIGGMGRWGMHIGGGLGGIYVDNLDIINCGRLATSGGLKVDTALVASQNRELQFFNVTIDGNTGPGVYINDSLIGTGWFIFNGSWISSNTSHGVQVVNFGSATIQFLGGTIYNNTGTGLLGLSSGYRGFVNGTDFRNNAGGAVNAFSNWQISTNSFASNTGFDVVGGAIWYSCTARDSLRYSTWSSGFGSFPVENFDSNDYSLYDRTNNRFEYYIGGVRRGYINTSGFNNG